MMKFGVQHSVHSRACNLDYAVYACIQFIILRFCASKYRQRGEGDVHRNLRPEQQPGPATPAPAAGPSGPGSFPPNPPKIDFVVEPWGSPKPSHLSWAGYQGRDYQRKRQLNWFRHEVQVQDAPGPLTARAKQSALR